MSEYGVKLCPQTHYHISDSEDRQSILEHGLLSAAERGRRQTPSTRPVSMYLPGALVNDRVFVSKGYIGGHKPGTHDIWAVDIEGLPNGPRLDYCYEGEVVLATPCVEPSRLTLLVAGNIPANDL
jgi:hypothetical protein